MIQDGVKSARNVARMNAVKQETIMSRMRRFSGCSATTVALMMATLVTSVMAPTVRAQQAPAPAPAQGRGAAPQAPPVISPEVSADRRVTFRIAAPDAQTVTLRSPGDMGVAGRGGPMQLTKKADGVWETIVGPLPAGAYRYAFVV